MAQIMGFGNEDGSKWSLEYPYPDNHAPKANVIRTSPVILSLLIFSSHPLARSFIQNTNRRSQQQYLGTVILAKLRQGIQSKLRSRSISISGTMGRILLPGTTPRNRIVFLSLGSQLFHRSSI